jgi:peptidoglycan L-alanyl-D-glutamate endopeptidase CwlK
MEDLSLERLSLVHPALSTAIQQMAARLLFDVRVTQGLRTWSQQDQLFHQIPKVTDVPGGYSWHNFGLAVDCAPLGPDKSIDWNASHPQWIKMEQVGISVGLVSGSTWRTFPDAPHFQMTGRFGVEPDDEVRQLFKDGGIQAVWDEAFSVHQTSAA